MKRRYSFLKYISDLNLNWTDIYYYLHYQHQEKITHQVIRILQHIDKNQGVGINELATFLDVSQNTASENVKRIINKGYLQKQRDTNDERRVIIGLTKLGKEILTRNTSLDEGKLKRVFEIMNEKDKEKVINGFEILSEAVKKCTF